MHDEEVKLVGSIISTFVRKQQFVNGTDQLRDEIKRIYDYMGIEILKDEPIINVYDTEIIVLVNGKKYKSMFMMLN